MSKVLRRIRTYLKCFENSPVRLSCSRFKEVGGRCLEDNPKAFLFCFTIHLCPQGSASVGFSLRTCAHVVFVCLLRGPGGFGGSLSCFLAG